MTHKIRRAKNKRREAFFDIEVCILEVIMDGKAMSTISVSIFVISK